jgi:glycosyltransferase involved in cell wall biosynthesis
VRLAVVTSLFPIGVDETRGRPIVQTLEALAKLVHLEVFVPNARYPVWLAPRGYRYVDPPLGEERRGNLVVQRVRYGTLPIVGRVFNGYRAGRALQEPVAKFRPDAILAYWLYPDAFGAAAVAAKLRVPLISGARGSDIRARDSATLALTRRALARSARVLTVSDDLRSLATQRFGVPAERVTTIANGCDTSIFKPGDRDAARRSLGIAADARLVLFVGRVVAAKGVRELLTAWLELAKRDPQIAVAFVGDGPLVPELQRSASTAGSSARAHFPGAQSAAGVAEWMRACDVFCLPSHTEGYPNVLVEALACGRPVVATSVGGIPEIVDGGNGVLTPIGDTARLAAALRSALSAAWDETALSRRFARSWDDVARETLAVCSRALERASASAAEHEAQIAR